MPSEPADHRAGRMTGNRTITKREAVERIAEKTGLKKTDVKAVLQEFLDEIIEALGKGDRLEFRDFGVFEVKQRRARKAQNPKTLEEVWVPPKRTVKFKVGRLMKQTLSNIDGDIEMSFDDDGDDDE